jgi:hypothetical protein
MFGLKIVKSNTVYKLQDEVFDLRHQNTDLRYDVNRLIRDKKELFDDCFNLRNQNGVLIEKVNRLEIENRKLLDGTKQTQQQNMQQQALLSISDIPTRQNYTGITGITNSSGGVSSNTSNSNIVASDQFFLAIQSEAPVTMQKVTTTHSSDYPSVGSTSHHSYNDHSSSYSSSSDSGSSSSDCGGGD